MTSSYLMFYDFKQFEQSSTYLTHQFCGKSDASYFEIRHARNSKLREICKKERNL